jgi:hypothetical protein
LTTLKMAVLATDAQRERQNRHDAEPPAGSADREGRNGYLKT